MATTRAVVFAYHDVGVRCINALLSAGVEIPLIVTTRDDPTETQWFASAAALGAEYGLPVVMPDEVNTPELERTVRELRPDFVFSFYFRSMIGASLLKVPRLGALNIHGSLLPRYRGRAPVNWAILHGERETGATLHYMSERADAGDIVDQMAVPILENADAREVFGKVCFAAEIILARSLPGLINGTAPRVPQRLEDGNTSAGAVRKMARSIGRIALVRSITWYGRSHRRSRVLSARSTARAGRSTKPGRSNEPTSG